jgi:hypothetical protein
VAGDPVTCIRKGQRGWILVRNSAGVKVWVPSTYLQSMMPREHTAVPSPTRVPPASTEEMSSSRASASLPTPHATIIPAGGTPQTGQPLRSPRKSMMGESERERDEMQVSFRESFRFRF